MEMRSVLADCLRFYQQHLGIKADFVAVVLDKADWRRYAALHPGEAWPYGMTNVSSGPPYVSFIPVDDGGVITQGLLADQVHVTQKTAALLDSVHLSFDQAVRKFIVHPTLHEVGHALSAEYGIQYMGRDDSAWLNELLASYFAYAFEKSKLPEIAIIMEAVTEMSTGLLKYTRLEDFPKAITLMRSGDTANFLWYQHQFQGQVARVFARRGVDFLADVKAEFPTSSKAELMPGETITKLEKISPGFQAWNSQMATQKR